MKNLIRQSLVKAPLAIREQLMHTVAGFIFSLTKPQNIIFFGSVITENFDDWSDIDVVAIYDSLVDADQARRKIYGAKQPQIKHPLEILCVDADTFSSKSKIGGVYFIAANDGRYFPKSYENVENNP
ncbi:MAG: nucleotidyltransferase domain-containing protein [Pseudobdellovibrionaceae bacterium]